MGDKRWYPPHIAAWLEKHEDCEGVSGQPCALRCLGKKRQDGDEWWHFACGVHGMEGYYDETGHPDYREVECFVDVWVSQDSGDITDVG